MGIIFGIVQHRSGRLLQIFLNKIISVIYKEWYVKKNIFIRNNLTSLLFILKRAINLFRNRQNDIIFDSILNYTIIQSKLQKKLIRITEQKLKKNLNTIEVRYLK